MTTYSGISLRRIGSMVRNLKLPDRSIILVKEGTPFANEGVLDDLRKVIGETSAKDVIIIVIDDFDNIKIMNERDMAQHGWIKTASIGKIIKRDEKHDNIE